MGRNELEISTYNYTHSYCNKPSVIVEPDNNGSSFLVGE